MSSTQAIHVRFFDDEVLEGESHNLDFDEADFQLEIRDASGLENSEVAWIPMSAVKMVDLRPQRPPESSPGDRAGRKVAIRFLDGEVLRGHLDGDIRRHRYGITLELQPEAEGPSNHYGVPFSAVKAIFFVREFDGRAADEKGLPSDSYLARRTMAPLLDVMGEMDMLSRLRESGVLTDQEFRDKRTDLLENL